MAIRLLCLDVDGVQTDGGLYYGSATAETETTLDIKMVRFYSPDGHGQRMLQDAGIKVAWITGNHWPSVKLRAKTLGVHYLATGIDDKGSAFKKVAQDLGVPLEATAFMGDDLNDLGALKLAGLKLAPANAAPEVIALADIVTVACGGEGAVREIANLLLAARKSS